MKETLRERERERERERTWSSLLNDKETRDTLSLIHKYKTANCELRTANEDWTEERIDPDWLIEQSIVRKVARRGGGGGWVVFHCATLKKSIKSLPRSLWKVESRSTFSIACGNNNNNNNNCKRISCYLGMFTLAIFWCNLHRNKIAKQVARTITQCNSAFMQYAASTKERVCPRLPATSARSSKGKNLYDLVFRIWGDLEFLWVLSVLVPIQFICV